MDNYLSEQQTQLDSEEAEEAVLCAVLLNPDTLLELRNIIQADDFFILRNAWVYEAMCNVSDSGLALDYITLTDELRRQRRLDEIGGSGYITYLLATRATHVHFRSYATLVFRLSLRRQLLALASDLATYSTSDQMDALEVFGMSQTRFNDIGGRLASANDIEDHNAGSLARQMVDNIIDGRAAEVYSTGIEPLDKALVGGYGDVQGGIELGQLMVIAGYSKHGKTDLMKQLALNLAHCRHYATNERLSVMYIALEGNADGIMRRWLSQMTGYNRSNIKSAIVPPNPSCPLCSGTGTTFKHADCDCHLNYGKSFHTKLLDASEKLEHDLDLEIVAGNFAPFQVKQLVLRKNALRPRHVVVIDYVQEFSSEPHHKSKFQTYDDAIEVCRWLAVETKAIVITGSQFNRDNQVDTNRQTSTRPQLKDLYGTSLIEKKADFILGLVRDYDESGVMTNDAKLWYMAMRDAPPQSYTPLVAVTDRSSFMPKHED